MNGPSKRAFAALISFCGALLVAGYVWTQPAHLPLPSILSPLHRAETSTIGTYAWTEGQGLLDLPLPRTGSILGLAFELTGGPSVEDTRPLTVALNGATTTFMLRGGDPRQYLLVVPGDGSHVAGHYSITPPPTVQDEDRNLGFVVRNIYPYYPAAVRPNYRLAALAVLPLLGWIALRAWRIGREGMLAVALLAALAITHYRSDAVQALGRLQALLWVSGA